YANKNCLCSTPLYSHSLATCLSLTWVLNSYGEAKKGIRPPGRVPACIHEEQSFNQSTAMQRTPLGSSLRWSDDIMIAFD
ncbi:hypothetical protein, partial [Undibacterium hunanense]|uniref:hypothetical protein n=1 Tax=Undibacterium hunanense TaxID=2762292 RepID=UPI001C9A5333